MNIEQLKRTLTEHAKSFTTDIKYLKGIEEICDNFSRERHRIEMSDRREWTDEPDWVTDCGCGQMSCVICHG